MEILEKGKCQLQNWPFWIVELREGTSERLTQEWTKTETEMLQKKCGYIRGKIVFIEITITYEEKKLGLKNNTNKKVASNNTSI